MTRFLSDEWFATASELARGVNAPAGVALRIQFAVGDDAWHLVATGGEPIELGRGRLDDAVPELHWERADAVRIWRRELRDDEALARTTVTDGSYVGPPSPADLATRPELDAMLSIPDATIAAKYDFRHGPFGAVRHVLFFEEGRLGRQQWGVVPDPDVVVHVEYEAIARVRSGEWTILDAMENGTIEGEIGPMAMLAGI
ncbi:MAG: hypothetical protein QOI55_1555, partial [Actinomycetota bacterium]|nr:hypothetical protein [Actinomycetota bacterium]